MKINYPEKIKEFRELNFLTQTEFANMLGVSFATINRWERSRFMPSIKMKKKLFDLFREASLLEDDSDD